ncbi:MAG: hypothetical protein QF578_19845, partial [Alphaproteobacteria bacterium]|nr:hypothetical protein [Alphaproteobacteria bacterium]
MNLVTIPRAAGWRGIVVRRSPSLGNMFKDNMIRNDQLVAEQEQERAAREERGRKIEGITENFDTAVANILET